MNSARELFQFDFDANAFARRAPRPIAIPQTIIADLERIVREYDGNSDLPEREDLRQIHHLFWNSTDRLRTEFGSLRRVRQLSWGLTYSQDGLRRIVDTDKLSDALQLIENHFRINALLGVFHALLEVWDAPNAEMLREFVRRHLASYNGRRRFVQHLRANLAWYCEENGATRVATSLLRDQVNLSDVWSHLNLPDYMRGYRYFGAVAEAYVTLNRRLDGESVVDIVNFVEMHRDDQTSRAIVSRTIENLGIDASESLRQPVQSYVLRNWADPRVAGGSVRWRGVSDEARQIFTRWIAEEDIRIFFDVVARNCNDPKFRYRKAFWLAYLGETDSGHIDSCRPVLRGNPEFLFADNPEARQYYTDRRPATLRGGNSDQHALIIQMGNHTFVEFSTAGACHVYDNAGRPFDLGDSQYNMIQLRSSYLARHRVIHSNSEAYLWQGKFESWIRSELGIEPLRSYRLGA